MHQGQASPLDASTNSVFDTLWLQRLSIQTTEPNLTNGALAESWILGGGPGVGFKLIYAVLCLPSQFENCTFCRAEYCYFMHLTKKLACLTNYLSGKTKFSMASCTLYLGYEVCLSSHLTFGVGRLYTLSTKPE